MPHEAPFATRSFKPTRGVCAFHRRSYRVTTAPSAKEQLSRLARSRSVALVWDCRSSKRRWMPTSDVKRGHAQFASRSHGGTKERDGASCSDGGQLFKRGPGKTRNPSAGKHRSIDTFPDLSPPSGASVVPRSLRHSSFPSSSTESRCPHGTDEPVLNIAPNTGRKCLERRARELVGVRGLLSCS